MIKAVVFVDGVIKYIPVQDSYGVFDPVNVDGKVMPVSTLPIDAKYGYSDTQESIEEALKLNYPIVIVTNSLNVFNDFRLKSAVSDCALLKNYYILDKNYELVDITELTDKELWNYHNLENMYTCNCFNRGDKNVKK